MDPTYSWLMAMQAEQGMYVDLLNRVRRLRLGHALRGALDHLRLLYDQGRELRQGLRDPRPHPHGLRARGRRLLRYNLALSRVLAQEVSMLYDSRMVSYEDYVTCDGGAPAPFSAHKTKDAPQLVEADTKANSESRPPRDGHHQPQEILYRAVAEHRQHQEQHMPSRTPRTPAPLICDAWLRCKCGK